MLAKKHRTYSLRSNTSAPPSASLAATAAASSALSSNANSRCNSLSSQAAAAALRRYSLTQDSLRKVPDFSHYTPAPTTSRRPTSLRSQRQNSEYTTTTRMVNQDRSMSLTRTTVKTLGSFELTTTKTTHLPPPTTSSHSRPTSKRPRKKKAASILSYESDLNSVMEEDTNYSFIQNFSAIHETPRTLVTPEPRPIRSALKPNQSPHARKHSSGSRVSFSSQSSTNPSVSHYVNKNTSTKAPAVVDSDSSSGNSIYSDASEFFPPVVVDIINHKRVITAPPAPVSPPSSHGSPNTSPTQLTPQQRRRSTYTTNERVSEYLNNRNGTKKKTRPATANPANATPAPRKPAVRQESTPPTDYTKHVLKRTPSNSSFERARSRKNATTKNPGGFKLMTLREPNQRLSPKQQQQLETVPATVAAQPHNEPFRSRFEDSDSDSELPEMPGSVPVAKRTSPISLRFSLRNSNRESVPEPARSPAAPKQTKIVPIAEENHTPAKPVKKKKFQGLRRIFGLL